MAGVGYAGEMHFLYRNLKFPSLTEALKHPEETGVLAIAVFLNVGIFLDLGVDVTELFFCRKPMTITLH